jgi:uncharacterized protein (UPF0276 family)
VYCCAMCSNIRLAANGIELLYDCLNFAELPIDYIKCPLSPDSRAEVFRALRFRPVLLHGWGPPTYNIFSDTVPKPELLSELVEQTKTPYLSVHLDYYGDVGSLGNCTKALDQIQANVQKLQATVGVDILLENTLHYPWVYRPQFITDPAFWRDVIATSGAEMLLDLAHARVASHHLGIDARGYISGFPLPHVREVHISGPRMEKQGLKDSHLFLGEEDFELLAWIKPQLPCLEILTLEYSGGQRFDAVNGDLISPEDNTARVLIEQLERLGDLLTSGD